MDGRLEIPLVFQGAGARPEMDVPRWAFMPPQRPAAVFSGAPSGLSASERADTQGFLREMLRILPLLGVRVFEKPTAVASPGKTAGQAPSENREDARDTVIVPAQQDGFERVFLGQHCWFAIRIGGGMLSKIKYIAAYQSNPISAITTYAKVDRIEPYGHEGKYKLIFAEPAKPLPRPIPFADATTGSMQGPRYTSLTKLLAAKRVTDLFTRESRNLTTEPIEFLDGDLGSADDAPEGSAVELVMKGHRDGRTAGTHQPHMAAFLTKDGVAELRQGSDAGSSGDDGKRRHGQAATLMSTTS